MILVDLDGSIIVNGAKPGEIVESSLLQLAIAGIYPNPVTGVVSFGKGTVPVDVLASASAQWMPGMLPLMFMQEGIPLELNASLAFGWILVELSDGGFATWLIEV